MNIRKLNVNDIDVLRKASALYWKEHKCDQQIKEFLKGARNHVYIALENEDIAGLAFGYVLETFYSEPMFYIHSIDVTEGYRRKGLGTALMNLMIDECRKKGIRECFLVTSKSNKPAVRLYESTGGKSFSHDDIVYDWKL